MVEQDTIKLLRECDAGVKMGVSSIDDVMDHVNAEKLRDLLRECRAKHEQLDKELQTCWTSTMMTARSRIPWPRGCRGSRPT